jgi:hypothetical protein
MVAAACNGDSETSLEDALAEGVEHVQQPIQGGYKDDVDTAVVGLVRLAGGGISGCSGTLIAPNVVLTAQHCVAPTSGNGSVICGKTYFGPTYEANSMYVTTRPQFSQNPSDYHRSKEIIVPPGGSDFCGRDIAIIVLDAPVPGTEAVPYVPRVDSSLERDDEYYAVGYGQIYDGGPSGRRYRRDGLFTKCVGGECPAFISTDTEWQGDTGICQGDSGGPAFDMQNRVVGVASRGAPGCESPTYGHVLGWGTWIKEVTLYATSSAGLEAPDWATGWPTDPAYGEPVGSPCSMPSDCPSNACLDGYCTRLCIESAPCPEGFSCRDDGVCGKNPEVPTETPETKKPSSGDSTTEGSCSLQQPPDPTKPIPWPVFALLGLAGLRKRRRPA